MLKIDSRPGANGRHPIFDYGANGYSARWVDDTGAMRYSEIYTNLDDLEEWFYSLNRKQLNTVGEIRVVAPEQKLITVAQRWKASGENSDEWRSLNQTYLRFVAPMVATVPADKIADVDVDIISELIEDSAGTVEARNAREVLRRVRNFTPTYGTPEADVVVAKRNPYRRQSTVTASTRKTHTDGWDKTINKVRKDSQPLAKHSPVYKQVVARYANILSHRPRAQAHQREIQPINLYVPVDAGSVVELWSAWHYSKILRNALALSHMSWENYAASRKIASPGTFAEAFFRLVSSRKLKPLSMLTWLHTWETTPLALEGDQSITDALQRLQKNRPKVFLSPANAVVYDEIIRLITSQNTNSEAKVKPSSMPKKTTISPITPSIQQESITTMGTTYNDMFDSVILGNSYYSASTQRRLSSIWKKHIAPTTLASATPGEVTYERLLQFWAEVFVTQEIAESNISKLTTILRAVENDVDNTIVPENSVVKELKKLIEDKVPVADAIAELLPEFNTENVEDEEYVEEDESVDGDEPQETEVDEPEYLEEEDTPLDSSDEPVEDVIDTETEDTPSGEETAPTVDKETPAETTETPARDPRFATVAAALHALADALAEF